VQQLVRLTLCFPWAGTSTARSTLFGTPEAQPKALAAGIEFQVIGEKDFLVGSTTESLTVRATAWTGCITIYHFTQEISAVTLRCSGFNESSRCRSSASQPKFSRGGTIADFLEIPFVTVCSAVVLNREPGIPPLTPIGSIAQLGGHVYVTKWVILLNRVAKPPRRDRRVSPSGSYPVPKPMMPTLNWLSQAPAEFEYPKGIALFHFHRNLFLSL